jgi:RNA polymerase sigma-70 factor (ECF subfamily)
MPRAIAAPDRAAPVDSASRLEEGLLPFRSQVQRHIRAMVRDVSLAEELTQDTYERAFTRIGQLRDPQAALAWLYRIATSVSLDRLRQRRPPAIELDTIAPSAEVEGRPADCERPASVLEAALERSEMSECVQAYLTGLPDDYRIAILLHDGHGLTNPEIAELLGCSLATAKIRVHRARARLREALAAACSFEVDERGVLICDPQPDTRMTASARAAAASTCTRFRSNCGSRLVGSPDAGDRHEAERIDSRPKGQAR